MASPERLADSTVTEQTGNRNTHLTALQDSHQRDPGREQSPGLLVAREAVRHSASQQEVHSEPLFVTGVTTDLSCDQRRSVCSWR